MHLRFSALQEGFLGAPTKPAGILVRRFSAQNPDPSISLRASSSLSKRTLTFASQNIELAALPTLAAPYGGQLARSYETAVARARAAAVTPAMLHASVTEVAA